MIIEDILLLPLSEEIQWLSTEIVLEVNLEVREFTE